MEQGKTNPNDPRQIAHTLRSIWSWKWLTENLITLFYHVAYIEQTTDKTQVKARHWLNIDTFECFVRHVEVVTVVVTDRALLTSAFWEAEEDEMVVLVEEEEEGEGGKAVDCCGGRGGKVEAVVVLGEGRCGALPRCELSCFAVGPPPFCAGLCLTIFSSSIWVSAVPWARPKSTSAYL